MQTNDQLTLWPEPVSGSYTDKDSKANIGRTIELVAINHCVQYSKTLNYGLQRYDYPLDRKERITILWVEWKNNVAYRLACGYINKEAWESLVLETINLVLG